MSVPMYPEFSPTVTVTIGRQPTRRWLLHASALIRRALAEGWDAARLDAELGRLG